MKTAAAAKRIIIWETLTSVFVSHFIVTLTGCWSCLGKEIQFMAQTLEYCIKLHCSHKCSLYALESNSTRMREHLLLGSTFRQCVLELTVVESSTSTRPDRCWPRPLRPPQGRLVSALFRVRMEIQQSLSLSRKLDSSVFAGGSWQRAELAVLLSFWDSVESGNKIQNPSIW